MVTWYDQVSGLYVHSCYEQIRGLWESFQRSYHVTCFALQAPTLQVESGKALESVFFAINGFLSVVTVVQQSSWYKYRCGVDLNKKQIGEQHNEENISTILVKLVTVGRVALFQTSCLWAAVHLCYLSGCLIGAALSQIVTLNSVSDLFCGLDEHLFVLETYPPSHRHSEIAIWNS